MEYNEDDFGLSNIGLIDDIRVKVNRIPVVEYKPKVDSKLWFMNDIDNSNKEGKPILDKKRSEQIRKEGIKNSQFKIDYLYSIGDYKECINVLNHLKTLVKLKKKQDYNDDIIDTEIRCNFKLSNFNKVIELIKNVESTLIAKSKNNQSSFQFKDTNLIYILAQSYQHKQEFIDSKIQYHRCINLNRRIWEWWLNLSLVYLNNSNIISKQNLNLLFNNDDDDNVDLGVFFNENQIKNEISFTNRVLAYRSLCHSLFLLIQSIQSKKKSFKDTNGFKQLEKMKLVIDSLLIVVSIKTAIQESEIITEDLISTTTCNELLKKESNNNSFEIKWLIDFKVDNFKNDQGEDDDEDEEEEVDREANPFTL